MVGTGLNSCSMKPALKGTSSDSEPGAPRILKQFMILPQSQGNLFCPVGFGVAQRDRKAPREGQSPCGDGEGKAT